MHLPCTSDQALVFVEMAQPGDQLDELGTSAAGWPALLPLSASEIEGEDGK